MFFPLSVNSCLFHQNCISSVKRYFWIVTKSHRRQIKNSPITHQTSFIKCTANGVCTYIIVQNMYMRRKTFSLVRFYFHKNHSILFLICDTRIWIAKEYSIRHFVIPVYFFLSRLLLAMRCFLNEIRSTRCVCFSHSTNELKIFFFSKKKSYLVNDTCLYNMQ